MKHFSKQNILDLEKVKRLNIINSITGIKPANLIGSIDDNNENTNLAIFSSVVHLGSHPALLGFIPRVIKLFSLELTSIHSFTILTNSSSLAIK